VTLCVTYDSQVFDLQRRGGISRYFVEIAREFLADPTMGVSPKFPFPFSENFHLQSLRRRIPAGASSIRDLAALANRLSQKSFRHPVWHSTYYDPRVLDSAVRSRHHVVTIHDMIPEDLPESFPEGNPHQAKRAYVAEADAIICVSGYTRQRLLWHYPRVSAPVHIIPEAASSAVRKTTSRIWDKPYLVYVGMRRVPYKNFGRLLEAFALVRHEHRDIRLLAVGGGALTESETRRITSLGLTGAVRQANVDDEELSAAYSGALATVVPSLSEGFGLPAVEAMRCGCPTILARAGSLPEIGEGAATYFDPRSSQEMADAILRVVGDTTLSVRLSDPDARVGHR